MAWEIESETVDKSMGTHTFILIERSVIRRDGELHRYEYTIQLGMGTDGESCGHCNQPVQRDISLGEDGTLKHATRGDLTPRDFVNEKLAELNAFHDRMDAYIAKHKATVYKGPK